MKQLLLTNGGYTLLDDKDYKYYSKWHWCRDSLGYAKRVVYLGGGRKNQKLKSFYLHREIMKTPTGLETDHINRSRLDNRRSNLRIVTRQQNGCNRGTQRNNTSGFIGVTWLKKNKKWMAQIKVKQKHIYLGSFSEKEDAARKYDEEVVRYFGEFAQKNYV